MSKRLLPSLPVLTLGQRHLAGAKTHGVGAPGVTTADASAEGMWASFRVVRGKTVSLSLYKYCDNKGKKSSVCSLKFHLGQVKTISDAANREQTPVDSPKCERAPKVFRSLFRCCFKRCGSEEAGGVARRWHHKGCPLNRATPLNFFQNSKRRQETPFLRSNKVNRFHPRCSNAGHCEALIGC